MICSLFLNLLFYKLLSGTGTFLTTVDGASLSISQGPDPHQSLSFTPTPSDNPSDDVGPSDGASDNVGLIVAVILMVGALLPALAVVGATLIVIMVNEMKRKGKQRTCDVPPTDGSSSG